MNKQLINKMFELKDMINNAYNTSSNLEFEMSIDNRETWDDYTFWIDEFNRKVDRLIRDIINEKESVECEKYETR